MPEDLANSQQAQGLCISGCPKREIIDYREILSFTEAQLKKRLPKRKVTRREATKECRNSRIQGFYLDSCVFDLLTTGDRNFTKAAKSALEDAFTLDSEGIVHDINTYNETILNILDLFPTVQVQAGGVSNRTRTSRNSVSKRTVLSYWLFLLVCCRTLWTILS